MFTAYRTPQLRSAPLARGDGATIVTPAGEIVAVAPDFGDGAIEVGELGGVFTDLGKGVFYLGLGIAALLGAFVVYKTFVEK